MKRNIPIKWADFTEKRYIRYKTNKNFPLEISFAKELASWESTGISFPPLRETQKEFTNSSLVEVYFVKTSSYSNSPHKNPLNLQEIKIINQRFNSVGSSCDRNC